MKSSSFWQKWLVAASLAMSIFGLLMVLFIHSAIFAPLTEQIDKVFWSGSATTLPVLQFQKWVYGVWGATVAAFGLLAAWVARHAFARREPWARDALAAAVACWYLLDTAVSVASGVWANAILNTVVLALFLPPLIATWRQFTQGTD